MAAILQDSLPIPPVELISGGRGEFSIWVGDTCVAQKGSSYPSVDDVVEAVRTALS